MLLRKSFESLPSTCIRHCFTVSDRIAAVNSLQADLTLGSEEARRYPVQLDHMSSS